VGSTSDYYKKNPKARAKRNEQQKRYNKSGKGNAIAKRANRANRALGTYGNGDGKDAAHTGPNRAKLEAPSTNRAKPRKGKKYSSGKGRKIS
tara:strand:- start:2057 stop:2332 length:276 start_codon:yes stop_codon:yes gene_type:complete